MAFFLDIPGATDTGVEGMGEFELVVGGVWGAEDDVAALAEAGEGLAVALSLIHI